MMSPGGAIERFVFGIYNAGHVHGSLILGINEVKNPGYMTIIPYGII